MRVRNVVAHRKDDTGPHVVFKRGERARVKWDFHVQGLEVSCLRRNHRGKARDRKQWHRRVGARAERNRHTSVFREMEDGCAEGVVHVVGGPSTRSTARHSSLRYRSELFDAYRGHRLGVEKTTPTGAKNCRGARRTVKNGQRRPRG